MVYDKIIDNIQCVNLFTKEIYPAQIGIRGERIAHVTQPGQAPICGTDVYDGNGKFALPGLIDTHLHLESSMVGPRRFCDAVVPHGTTTICADPHEIANVMGLDGISFMLDESRDLPLRVMILAPSCVPSVPGVETSRTKFDSFVIARMLANERVVGLGEVMDYTGVICGERRMRQILDVSRKSGKFIQGHAPEVSGESLSKYLAAGCCSDHETHSAREALEKLRAGMVLECRCASNCPDLDALAETIIRCGYPENVTFCTDDTEPADLVENGHMDKVIRRAVRLGMDPLEAVKIATVNAARLTRLYDRGSLKPGNFADIILVENLKEFRVDEVFCGGVLTACGGKMLKPCVAEKTDIVYRNTVYLTKPVRLEDFRIYAKGEQAVLNVIRYQKEDCFVTTLDTESFKIEDGFAQVNNRDDFCTFTVFERHGVNGNHASAPVHGLGLKCGAVATTVSHDCHNLFIAGKNEDDMLLAANTLSECGGGVVCVQDGRIRCLLRLPVAGLMADRPLEELAGEMSRLTAHLRAMGLPGPSPYMMLTSFALAVIPQVRLTDCGLVNTLEQKILPVLVKTI